jgi:hypothetical protein
MQLITCHINCSSSERPSRPVLSAESSRYTLFDLLLAKGCLPTSFSAGHFLSKLARTIFFCMFNYFPVRSKSSAVGVQFERAFKELLIGGMTCSCSGPTLASWLSSNKSIFPRSFEFSRVKWQSCSSRTARVEKDWKRTRRHYA